MKYIMFDIPFGTMVRRTPIMFPNYLVHSIVAEALQAHPLFKGAIVHSAGEFSSVDLGDVQFTGGSTSLKVESDPADDAGLAMTDYHHGLL